MITQSALSSDFPREISRYTGERQCFNRLEGRVISRDMVEVSTVTGLEEETQVLPEDIQGGPGAARPSLKGVLPMLLEEGGPSVPSPAPDDLINPLFTHVGRHP